MTRNAPSTSFDERVFLHGVSWEDYETVLAIRGESSAVRIAYREGELELMSPSRPHEFLKKSLARLVEAWAEVHDVELNGAGSWTVKLAKTERGAEADECYIIGSRDTNRPDIAIDVVWTHGGLDKLDIYRGLDVPEVWIWMDNKIQLWALRCEGEENFYERIPRSELLPTLDFDELMPFLDRENQTRAVREYRQLLQAQLDA